MPRQVLDYPVTVNTSSTIAFPIPAKAVYRVIIKCKVATRPSFVGVYKADSNMPKMWSGYYYIMGRNCVIKEGSINYSQCILYDETTEWGQEQSIRAYSMESLTPDPDLIGIIDELAFIAAYGNYLPEPLLADSIIFNIPLGVVLNVNIQYLYYDDIQDPLNNDVPVAAPVPYPDPSAYPIPSNPNESDDMSAWCSVNYPGEPPTIEQFIADNPDYFGSPYRVLVDTSMGYNLMHRYVLSKSGIFTHVKNTNCAIPGTYYSSGSFITCSHCGSYGVSNINILYTDGMPAKTVSGFVVASTCGNVNNSVISAVLE